MDKDYWNRICEDYETEILSVFDNDLHGAVKNRVLDFADSNQVSRVADIGCGVGRFTPLLAERFEEVEACDFSSVGLNKTRRRCRGHANVNFHKVDLSLDPIPFEPVDFAFCVNVLIMPSLDKRLRAWRAVANQVAQGGSLLLVVPSFESVQMEFYSAIETHLSAGESCGEAVRNSTDEKALAADLRLGVHQLDGIRTKHYLKDELAQMLQDHQFEIREISKLLYSEDKYSGFHSWDWLAIAVRK
ncbi:class I SAM-dependent methyltransferase [Pelagicoccus sp. SDUM812003]|uniref:class I SAM-dependent methyltransferase n=1 Tax=Pelagicoccus sp. SDUM812003 TaxID=3041267 RepID=UPI00280F14A2|nr:class I SAM-dependent methyltransferase [Pelagicoccus sp. SDUM812003]MDQ8204613.1 class I SAM-dependent methyltransferase [Pelagicoccus sp. SDUM812003]